MTTTLVVYQREDGLYDWRLMAANGEEIASSASQGYTQRNDAREGWERVVKAVEGGEVVVVQMEVERGSS